MENYCILITQIEQIKAYAFTDWGLHEYEQIDVIFTGKYRIKLDGSLEEHRNFTQTLMEKLNIGNKILYWGFLPHLGNKAGREIIFDNNKIR